MRALLGYRLRQEGDAEPGAAEFGDEVDLTAAGDDARLEAVTAAGVKDDPVEGEAELKEMNGVCLNSPSVALGLPASG